MRVNREGLTKFEISGFVINQLKVLKNQSIALKTLYQMSFVLNSI